MNWLQKSKLAQQQQAIMSPATIVNNLQNGLSAEQALGLVQQHGIPAAAMCQEILAMYQAQSAGVNDNSTPILRTLTDLSAALGCDGIQSAQQAQAVAPPPDKDLGGTEAPKNMPSVEIE